MKKAAYLSPPTYQLSASHLKSNLLQRQNQEVWNRLNYAPMDFEGFTPFALMPRSLMRMHQHSR